MNIFDIMAMYKMGKAGYGAYEGIRDSSTLANMLGSPEQTSEIGSGYAGSAFNYAPEYSMSNLPTEGYLTAEGGVQAAPIMSTELAGGGAGYGLSGGGVAAQPIGTAMDGGLLMSDGTVQAANAGGGAVGSTGAELGTSAGLSSYLPYVAAALGTYNAYDQFKHEGSRSGMGGQALRGASSGAAVGNAILPGGWGALGGAIIGGGAGAIQSATAGGKGREHQRRDSIRQYLKDVQYLDEDNVIKNPDGTFYDIGQDGGSKQFTNMDGTSMRRFYDVDWSDPTSADTVADLTPLMHLMFPGDKDAEVAFTGYHTNAAQKSKNQKEAIQSYYEKAGMTNPNLASQAVWEMFKNGGYENDENFTAEQKRNSDLAAIDKLYGIKNPNQGKGGKAEFGDAYIEENKPQQPQQTQSTTPKTGKTVRGALLDAVKNARLGESKITGRRRT